MGCSAIEYNIPMAALQYTDDYIEGKVKVKKVNISLLQSVGAHRVERGRGSHIT
jgi:hypothetical protein